MRVLGLWAKAPHGAHPRPVELWPPLSQTALTSPRTARAINQVAQECSVPLWGICTACSLARLAGCPSIPGM